MKKTLFCSVIVAMSMATAAFAADMKPAASPMASPAKSGDMKKDDMKGGESAMAMPKAGEESKKLGAFFAHGGTWTGKLPAGAMGPDSKEMTSKGKAVCKEMFNGMAYSCDVTDAMGKMTWMGHMVTGWDMASKSYKSVMADNMGTITSWTGTMSDDGKKFALESDKEMQMGNSPMFKDRLTWDMTSGKMMFTDEHGVNGQWSMWESAEMKGTGAMMAPGEKKNTSGTDKPAGETNGAKK